MSAKLMFYLQFPAARWGSVGFPAGSKPGANTKIPFRSDYLRLRKNKTGTIAQAMLYVDNGGFAEGSLSRSGQRAYRVALDGPRRKSGRGWTLYAASGGQFCQ